MRKLLSMILLAVIAVIMSEMFSSCGNTYSDFKFINGTADSILGKELYDKLIEKYEFIGYFEHGTIVVKSTKYGLLDYKGDEVLPCRYDSIYQMVNDARIIKSNGKYGIINEQASFIAECKYDSVLSPSPRYAPVMLNKKWGFQDRDGNKIISYKYDNILNYDDSVFVAKYNGKYGIADYEGNTIVKYICGIIYYKIYDSATYIEYGGKIALLNSKLKQVTDNIFMPGFGNYYDEGGLAHLILASTNKCGVVNVETGKTVIPFEYDKINLPSEELLCGEKDGKYGYLNIKNETVIPFIYDDGKDFSEGLAMVGKNSQKMLTQHGVMWKKKYGFINKKGEIEIPLKFADQTLVSLNSKGGFHDGLAAIGIDRPNYVYAGAIGYINKKGDFVISPQYDDASAFFCEVAVIKKDDKYGAINKKGDIIIPIQYGWGEIIEKDSIIGMGYNYEVTVKYNLKGDILAE